MQNAAGGGVGEDHSAVPHRAGLARQGVQVAVAGQIQAELLDRLGEGFTMVTLAMMTRFVVEMI